MKIEGPGSLRNGPARRAGRTDGGQPGAFARALQGGDESAAPGVGGAAPAGGVNPLLSLQELEDATSSPHGKARARAETLLDRLEDIRMGLLSGSLPASRLEALTRIVQTQRATVDDPELAAILDEIDLRAQVELAKLAPRE
ncbi:MAG TPA: flagellar assembly protein FliX [Arenibaculum sp.]|nr:flagellar assembly protein FliX [Arenibaculum sp.]